MTVRHAPAYSNTYLQEGFGVRGYARLKSVGTS